MTRKVITASPDDTLARINEIFEENNLHHMPVVRYKTIVGMISKSDLLHFMHGFQENEMEKFIDTTRLRTWKAEEIMTKGLAKVDSQETIRNVLELFLLNRFHAIPVVDSGELVGIITTFDIIKAVADEPVNLKDYQATAKI